MLFCSVANKWKVLSLVWFTGLNKILSDAQNKILKNKLRNIAKGDKKIRKFRFKILFIILFPISFEFENCEGQEELFLQCP